MGKRKHTQCWPSILTEETGNLISNTLGAGEDQNLVGADLHDLLEVASHLIALLEVGHDFDDLVDPVISRQVHRANVDLDVVVQEVRRKLADLLGPGGGPHAGLSVGTDLGDDGADLRLKTHVQHTISLVKDEVGDTAKIRSASVQHIDQTTRGSNAHLHAAAEVANLGSLGDTTVDASVANARRLSKLGHLGLNLNSKLTSRGKDKDNRSVTRSKKRLGVDMDDRGKTISKGLSGASLGDTDDIATSEGHRPALSLDRSWVGEALRLDLGQDILRETGFVESLNRTRDVSSLDGHLMLLAVFINLAVRAAGNIRVFLIEGLLKLGQGIQI